MMLSKTRALCRLNRLSTCVTHARPVPEKSVQHNRYIHLSKANSVLVRSQNGQMVDPRTLLYNTLNGICLVGAVNIFLLLLY